ncbi:MAG: SDR family oxidoreductase [Succinivibrionaceae bacterium]|nr:SDR family oxidoreductase [Succinivibrionaceae bacterium]
MTGILEGKTVLISGGSRGIGRAISDLYYAEGAKLYILARNAEKLSVAVEEIDTKKEGRVIGIPCDVGSKNSIDSAWDRIKADGAVINILVSCAGVNLRAPIEEMPLETWNKVIDINLTGAFLLAQKVFPDMRDSGGGKIVNIASLMSELARPGIPAYVASKGGIKMLTKSMAIEWAKYNIQANSIIPGYIATEMNKPLIEDEKFNQFIINRTPVGRWGKPEEIAATALFLVTKGADFITGQEIAVDGGILASL